MLAAIGGGPGAGCAGELEDCGGELQDDWGRIPRQRVEALRRRHLAQVTDEDGGGGSLIGSGAEAEAEWGARAGGLFMTACFLTGVEICDDDTVEGNPGEVGEAREVGEGVDPVVAEEAEQEDEVWKQFGREVDAHCGSLSPGKQVTGGGNAHGERGVGCWADLAFRLLETKYALVEEAEARAISWRLGRLQGALCNDRVRTRVTGEGSGEFLFSSHTLALSPSPFFASSPDTLGVMPVTCDRVFWCVSGELATERRKARDARSNAYALLQTIASNVAGGRRLPPPTSDQQDVPGATTAAVASSPLSTSTAAFAADTASATPADIIVAVACDFAAASSADSAAPASDSADAAVDNIDAHAPAAESAAGASTSSQAPPASSQDVRASACPLRHCPLPPTPLQPVICLELMRQDEEEGRAGCGEPDALPEHSCPGPTVNAITAATGDDLAAPAFAQHGAGVGGRGGKGEEVFEESVARGGEGESEWRVCQGHEYGMVETCSPPPPLPPTPPPLGIADKRLETQALLRRVLQPLPGEEASPLGKICSLSPSLESVRSNDDDGEEEEEDDDDDADDSLASQRSGRLVVELEPAEREGEEREGARCWGPLQGVQGVQGLRVMGL